MLSVSEIVAKAEAMFDLVAFHYFNGMFFNSDFAILTANSLIRHKIITCNFLTQE